MLLTVTQVVLPAPVDKCFRPKQLINAFVKLYFEQYGIFAVYTCRYGYRFVEGGTVRSVVCDGGTWSVDITDCEGKRCVDL